MFNFYTNIVGTIRLKQFYFKTQYNISQRTPKKGGMIRKLDRTCELTHDNGTKTKGPTRYSPNWVWGLYPTGKGILKVRTISFHVQKVKNSEYWRLKVIELLYLDIPEKSTITSVTCLWDFHTKTSIPPSILENACIWDPYRSIY